MKKIFFLFFFFCFMARVMAIDVIVGTGTSSAKSYPYSTYYKYSTEEFLYTSDEIPAGEIEAISFYVSNASSLSATVNIYMGHTNNSSLTSYISYGLTCVYSGTRTLGSSTGWEKISLPTKFVYNGIQNLILVVTKSCSNYNGSLTYRYTSGGYGLCRNSDSNSADANYSNTSNFSTTSDRPNTMFSYNTISPSNVSYSSKYDFTSDNLFYDIVSLTDLTCELTHGEGYQQNTMTIPNTVDFNGKTLSVVGINHASFLNNTNLTNLQLPAVLQNIKSSSFYLCMNLQSLSIPNGVTIIPDSMAMWCSSLNSLSLGENTTSIGKYSFYKCSSLSKIVLPSTVTAIDDNAFGGCTNVKKLTIGDSNSTLNLGKNGSYGAFYGLPIDTLYIGKNLSYDTSNAQYAPFYSNSTLQQLTIGNQVTEFPDTSLATKTTLTDLYVGDGLKEIPSFNTCVNLKKLTLGAGLTSIPTFVACEQIDTIYLRSTTPQPAEEFTNKIYVNCVLKVPAGSLAAYQSADVWKNFWLISEYDVQSGTDSTPGLRISRSNMQLREGATATLTAKIFPENVLCENVQWKSDNSEIASINQAGVVTAIKEGSAHIIALTTDGTNFSDTCLVTVLSPYDLGDVNDDGSINVADVNGVVNFILDTNTENLIYRAADINKDNRILVDDLSDIITMVMEGATPNQARAKMQTRAAQTYDNYLVITSGEESYDIAVSLAEKVNDFSGLQFDVTLPEGYVMDDAAVINEDAQLVLNELPNNDIRIMIYSPSNSAICSGDNIISLKLKKITGISNGILVTHSAVATDNKANAYSIGSCQYQLSEATNISSVDAPMNSNHAIYNLLGQKVNAKNKGIYIYKGKKFVNK